MQVILSLVKRGAVALVFAALAFAPVWTPPAQAGGNLVVNGDFINTVLSFPGGYICVNSGSSCTSQVASWSAACAQGNCNGTNSPSSLLFPGGGSAWNDGFGLTSALVSLAGYSGNYIGLDGDAYYAVPFSQSVADLTLGRTYQLTFYESATQQGGAQNNTSDYFQVSFGSATQNSALIYSNGAQSAWQSVSMSFTDTGGASETLSFFAVGTGVPPIALLADVSMSAVPEPATWALMLLGFAGLGFAGFRSARRKAIAAT